MQVRPSLIVMAALALLILLTACGGGGGGGEGDEPLADHEAAVGGVKVPDRQMTHQPLDCRARPEVCR